MNGVAPQGWSGSCRSDPELLFIRAIRTTMMKLYARPARIWSAVTCHRFYRFGDLSPKQGRVQRPGRDGRLLAFDGDKSPAESADESAHSKVTAASPRWVIRGSFRGL